MRVRNFWAVAALCGGIVMFGSAQAQTQVTKWPDDVPCSSISKNPDGSYTLVSDITLSDGTIMQAGNVFPSLAEYGVWVTKCG
jgi:hypothetical protein